MPAERNDGGQAFPMPLANEYGFEGMSLRDHFAGQALAGILASPATTVRMGAPKVAYAIADAMLVEKGIDGWFQMDIAPKDGRSIMLWWPAWAHYPVRGYWIAEKRWHAVEALSDSAGPPLAWREFPTPPASRHSDGERR